MKAYEFANTDVVKRLKTFFFSAQHSLAGDSIGGHSSSAQGTSVEFSEYRKYLPGDDLRRLDWKAFGRSDQYYLKEYESETNLRAYFLLDTSGSMSFRSEGQNERLKFGKEFIFCLASLLGEQGDSVAMIGRQLKAGRSTQHMNEFFAHMDGLTAEGATTLTEKIAHTARTIPARSMVFIVSDFFVDLDELKHSLDHLQYRNHDVVLIHLLDVMECEFNLPTTHEFVDLETEASIITNSKDSQKSYQRLFESYLKQMRELCASRRVSYHKVTTDETMLDVIKQIFISRLQDAK